MENVREDNNERKVFYLDVEGLDEKQVQEYVDILIEAKKNRRAR